MNYTARIQNDGGTTTINANSLSEALEQARDWASDGDYGDEGGFLVRIGVVGEDGDEGETSVLIQAPEPPCTADEHDWQSPHSIVGGLRENPGVHGHGGGVRITECCMSCGCRRVTDTWAQDHSTGELIREDVYTYTPRHYAAEIAEESDCDV